MEATAIKARLEDAHPEHLALREHYDFMRQAYEGGWDYIRDNIFRHGRRETHSDYVRRLERAVYPNYCRPVIRTYRNHVFRFGDRIGRNIGDDAYQRWAHSDVDRRGSNANHFWSCVATLELLYGWAGVLVDMPKPSDGIRSAADQLSTDQMPYFILVSPTAILDWGMDEFGTLEWIRIEEASHGAADPFAARGDRKRYRIWTRSEWMLLDGDGDVVESGEHSLGVVPFVPIRFEESVQYELAGVSFMSDFARINRMIANSVSLRDGFLAKNMLQILTMQVNFMAEAGNDTDLSQSLQDGSMLEYPPDAKAPSFIAPDVGWLRGRLDEDGGFYELVGGAERSNLAFAGLVLRLADIMDFDATRAPAILFQHIGIENDTSILEWRKHLSITGWSFDTDHGAEPDLEYAAICDHPVYEKAIREFCGAITGELRAVDRELRAQIGAMHPRGAHYALHLPVEARHSIRARGPADAPAYIYHDFAFRLDQDEILQLLLGESLWGDPGLCIRELLQNALDALQMRELRLTMPGGKVADPTGGDEELEVVLTWGVDDASDREYILVRDNGIGMTRDVIERYFTKIGKSYYRSADFERERAALRRAGQIATPISYFGIGILSSFMIADRMEVRTNPGVPSEDAYDVTISGAGSLFWLKKGTLDARGTEIKLLLKDGYHIHHDGETLCDRVRSFHTPCYLK